MQTDEDNGCCEPQPNGYGSVARLVEDEQGLNEEVALNVKTSIRSMRVHSVHKHHLQRHGDRVLAHNHQKHHGHFRTLALRQDASAQSMSTPVSTIFSSPTPYDMPYPSAYSHGDPTTYQSPTNNIMPSHETKSSNISTPVFETLSSTSTSTSSTSTSTTVVYQLNPSQSFLASSPMRTYLSSSESQVAMSSIGHTLSAPYPTITNGTLQTTSTSQASLVSHSPEPYDPLISIILSIASVEASASNHLTLTATNSATSTTSIFATNNPDITSTTNAYNPRSSAATTSPSNLIVVINSTVFVIPQITSSIAAGSASSLSFTLALTTTEALSTTAEQSLMSSSFSFQPSTTLTTSILGSLQSSTCTSSSNSIFSSGIDTSSTTILSLSAFPSSTSIPSSNFIPSSTSTPSSTSIQSSLTTRSSTSRPTTLISSASESPASITGGLGIASGSDSSASAAATSTIVAIAAASKSSSTPPSTIAGSVVGSVAGLALLSLLALLLLRRWRRPTEIGGPAPAATASSQGPSSSNFFLAPTAAAFLNRLSLGSFAGGAEAVVPAGRNTPQRSFERLSGRKLPSQFSPGMEGPVGALQHPSGTSAYLSGVRPEMGENPFLDPRPSSAVTAGLGAAGMGAVGAAAAGSSRRDPGASFEHERDRETLMPSPARTPVMRSAPEGRVSYLAAPGVAGGGLWRPLTPSFGVGRGMGGSPSRPGTRGSTGTLGSRFIEDIS